MAESPASLHGLSETAHAPRSLPWKCFSSYGAIKKPNVRTSKAGSIGSQFAQVSTNSDAKGVEDTMNACSHGSSPGQKHQRRRISILCPRSRTESAQC